VTDDEVDSRLRHLAVRLAKSELEKGPASVVETLWYHGYLPAKPIVIAEGMPEMQVERVMAALKRTFDIVEPTDLVQLPEDILKNIRLAFEAELQHEPYTSAQLLFERHIKEITEFHVEMFSNEGKHPGKPHVRVRLKDGYISVSLDDTPVVLTPNKGLRGEAAALKVVKDNLDVLRPKWQETRPDTQKLPPKPQ